MARKFPKKSKLAFLFVAQTFSSQIPNDASIVKSMATTKQLCKNEQKCARCGQSGHEDQDCENYIKCANCDGDHPACTRHCPKSKTEKKILKRKFQNNIIFHEARQQVEGPTTDPSKNSYANVTKPHQWTNSIKNPNIFISEEEWLTLTIDSLLKRLDEIKKQKSNQNEAPCTSSASQSNQINFYLYQPKLLLKKEMNEQFRILGLLYHRLHNLRNLQLQMLKNEMESIRASTKRGHHDSSDEKPNSPVTKKPASVSPASERDGTPVLTGTGRGGLPKISTFCLDPPRQGQGSSGGEWSPISLLTMTNSRHN